MFRLKNDAPEMESMATKEVIIQNLDFKTSEAELTKFLKKWNPTRVLIPYQTMVGLRYYHPRPYGIAFVCFDTVEAATTLINDLQFLYYKGKSLRLNYHIPYESLKRKNLMAPQEYESENLPDDDELSKDTIYCRILPAECTDADLRNFVELYDPVEFWIYKSPTNSLFTHCCLPHYKKKGFILSALVKLGDGTNIDDVCVALNKGKLCNKKVKFIPALKHTIKEVKKATLNDTFVEANNIYITQEERQEALMDENIIVPKITSHPENSSTPIADLSLNNKP
ncbi:Rrt5p PWA37_005330 [Arxiozyma heterogenica]|uniref:RRM domain-containing protein n=1 Tax=Arxiozyma heterogenica TaxID=278026 RepID=A0AAN7ZZ63_9SACH|nr:hypothetical protein RI543_000261 [Kazachstania heterogenica]